MPQPSTPETMQAAVKDFAHLAFEVPAVRRDNEEFYTGAINLAEELGYTHASVGTYSGVKLRTGSRKGFAYVPGIEPLKDPKDHLRGIVSTIAIASQKPEVQTSLVLHALQIATQTVPCSGRPINEPAIERSSAMRVVDDELKALERHPGWPHIADVRDLLDQKWHPHRPARLVSNAVAIFRVIRRGEVH